MNLTIREITPSDYPILEDFIYNAIFVPQDEEAPSREIIYNPNVFIGTALLNTLFDLLRKNGFTQTSLAVQKENAAVRFYKRVGYEILHGNDEEWIMLKKL